MLLFALTEMFGQNFCQKFLKSARGHLEAELMVTFRGFEFEAKTKKL